MSGYFSTPYFSGSYFDVGTVTATCFDAAGFDPLYFFTCGGPPPVVETAHGGLFLDPPLGWQAISAPRGRSHGPLYPDKVLTHLDFNRDDPDELWLLGLTDLETN